jgi:hypothetical protein
VGIAPFASRAARAAGPPEEEAAAFLVFRVASDEEGLGDQVRLMLYHKARRLGAVVYDFRSVDEALAGEAVTLDTPADRLVELARDPFEADVAVAGRVLGRGPYTVRLRVAYPARPADERVVERAYECSHRQAIPLAMAEAVYGILGIEKPPDPLQQLRDDPEVRRRWAEGPNLVANPGFEEPSADGDGPAGWQPIEKEMAWVAGPDGPGRVLRYEMTGGTAATYGLDFYSDWIPIQPGAVYRFACRYKSLGPTVKVFLKGYHPFPATDRWPAQRRETYRRQVSAKGEKGEWHTVVADFIPTALRPEHAPVFLKIDFYAYHPAGVVLWDDVVLKKIRDAPASPKEDEGRKSGSEPAPEEARP